MFVNTSQWSWLAFELFFFFFFFVTLTASCKAVRSKLKFWVLFVSCFTIHCCSFAFRSLIQILRLSLAHVLCFCLVERNWFQATSYQRGKRMTATASLPDPHWWPGFAWLVQCHNTCRVWHHQQGRKRATLTSSTPSTPGGLANKEWVDFLQQSALCEGNRTRSRIHFHANVSSFKWQNSNFKCFYLFCTSVGKEQALFFKM